MMKMTKKITTTYRKRKDIEKDFITADDVILRIPLTEAIIRNQKLILESLLDVRDILRKSNKKSKRINS